MLPKQNPLYYVQPLSVINSRGKFLPEGYKKFYVEWKYTQPLPVHYMPKDERYEKDPESGRTTLVQNVPIPLIEPQGMENTLTGGEAVVLGFKKQVKYVDKVTKFWVPRFYDGVVYSEILDKHIGVVMTKRVTDLINENHGFDYYILGTRACDLRTLLGVKFKRKLLQELWHKKLYPDDTEKREEVYNKYKKFLTNYTEEDVEWYGLSIDEAIKKFKIQRNEENEAAKIPLKAEIRKEFIEDMKSGKLEEIESLQEKSWWRQKIFPFDLSGKIKK